MSTFASHFPAFYPIVVILYVCHEYFVVDVYVLGEVYTFDWGDILKLGHFQYCRFKLVLRFEATELPNIVPSQPYYRDAISSSQLSTR